MFFRGLIYFYFLSIFLFAFGACTTTKIIDTKNNDVFKEVKKTFASDLRVAIFDVKGIKHGKELLLKGETSIPSAKTHLLKKFSEQNMKITDSISLLPDIQMKKKFAVVRLSVCNIRTKPQHSAEMATQAILGTPLKLFKNTDEWSQVQTPDNYIGWVDNSGIEIMPEENFAKWLEMQKVISVTPTGSIQESPDPGARPVSDFVGGSILGLKGESDNDKFWIVTFPDNRIGYAEKSSFRRLEDFVEMSRFISGDDIVNSSYQFLGAPYLWGGTSSKGMDCSGFTKTVYFLNGMIIPRDASQQVMTGDTVIIDPEYSNFQPADLLFFGNKRNDNTERITHVALYLGDGKFIHSSGNVKVESLFKTDADYNDFRAISLLQVRRYLNSKNNSGIVKLTGTWGYFK